jgi:hypothetical protein
MGYGGWRSLYSHVPRGLLILLHTSPGINLWARAVELQNLSYCIYIHDLIIDLLCDIDNMINNRLF